MANDQSTYDVTGDGKVDAADVAAAQEAVKAEEAQQGGVPTWAKAAAGPLGTPTMMGMDYLARNDRSARIEAARKRLEETKKAAGITDTPTSTATGTTPANPYTSVFAQTAATGGTEVMFPPGLEELGKAGRLVPRQEVINGQTKTVWFVPNPADPNGTGIRVNYAQGDEITVLQDLAKNPKALAAAREQAWLAGKYGDEMPDFTGYITEADKKAWFEIVSEANMNGLTWNQYIEPMAEKARKYGRPISPGEAAQLQVQRDQTGVQTLQALQQFARDNGVVLTDKYLKEKQAAIVDGQITLDDAKGEIRKNYVSVIYPAFADDVMAGNDMVDLAAPYAQSLGSLLELPTDVSPFDDPLMKKALSYKDEKGNLSRMPYWEFESMVKQDERWQYTDNAREQIVGNMMNLGRLMGFEA